MRKARITSEQQQQVVSKQQTILQRVKKKQQQVQNLRKEIIIRKQPDKKQYAINKIFKLRAKQVKTNKKIKNNNNNVNKKIPPLQRIYKNKLEDSNRNEASPHNFYQYNRPPESRIRTQCEEKIFLKATAFLNILKNKKKNQ